MKSVGIVQVLLLYEFTEIWLMELIVISPLKMKMNSHHYNQVNLLLSKAHAQEAI